VPDVAIGTARERVESLVRHVAENCGGLTVSVCVPALIGGTERDLCLREFHRRCSNKRRDSLVQVIAAGVTIGEFPANVDAELAAHTLVGVIFYRRLMSSVPFDPAHAAQLVNTVLGTSEAR
jgi:TetR/AcrR family transcriptional regulator, regulator of autoinduction and epiphytic fitness